MSPDYRAALLVTAQALPPGSAVPVVRETLIELLGATALPAWDPPPDLTMVQVAQRFGRDPSTVRGWVASGRLTGAYRFEGRELRVPLSAVLGFEARQRQSTTPTPKPRLRCTRSRPPDLGSWRDIPS